MMRPDDWKLIFDSISDLIMVIDLDHKIIAVNPAVEKALAKSKKELVGKPCYEFFHCTDMPPAGCPHEKLVQSTNPETMDMEMEVLGGQYMVTVAPVFDDHGKLVRTVHIAKDITGRQQQDAFAISEGKIRALFNKSSDAMIIADTAGLVWETNEAAERMFGYSSEEMEHLPLADLMPERYRAEHLRGIKRATSTGKTTYLNRVLELHGLTKDNREFPLELNVSTWFVNKKQYFSSIIRDISARRQAEADLRESEEKLNIIFNSTNDGIVVADAVSRKIITGNRAICEMLGYSLEELINLSVDDIHPPESLQEVHRQFARQQRQEIDVYHNAPVMRKDKTVFFADINATPSKIGKKTCMIGLFRDITERIQMEERARQSQKIEAIGTLAGGIAHDFNNILSPIIGYTDLVMDSLPGGSEEASMLNEVKKASYRAKDLVQQILAFSRKSTQEKKPFIIQPIIKEAGKLLRSSIPSSIEIRQDIENNCGPVMCDPTQIHQIVMNLCTNAYHAMLQDGGILEISLSRIIVQREDPLATEGLAAGTYIRLIVSDTGHGMDKKTLTRIFEPYFTTKEKGEGTGLGLSLVQRIVEDHNGKINVYSNRGEGTTFTIYLPEVVLKAKDMGKGKKETLPRGTEHILLVDDEREIVAMLTRILEKLGYQVTGLTDSIEALECFKANPDQIDLVITDQTMPHMAGSELAKRMLEIKPGFPIILCTGFSSIISEKKAINIGIKKMLMKPVIRSELAKVIRSVLDDSDQKR